MRVSQEGMRLMKTLRWRNVAGMARARMCSSTVALLSKWATLVIALLDTALLVTAGNGTCEKYVLRRLGGNSILDVER